MVLDRTVEELESRTDDLVSQAADVTEQLEAQTRALLETWEQVREALNQERQGGGGGHG